MKHLKFAILYLILISSTSGNKDDCAQDLYLPVTITPEKTTYNIGDTITRSSKFSTYVTGYYYNGGKENRVNEFDMSGIKWQPFTDLFKIDTFRGKNLPPFSNFYPYFNLRIDTIYNYKLINYSNGSKNLFGEFNFVNDSFQLQFQIIPKISGIYMLKVGSLIRSSTVYKQTYPGDCYNANINSFDVFFNVNENRNNNFDLLLESPDSLYNDYFHRSRENFHNLGCYCFKVIN